MTIIKGERKKLHISYFRYSADDGDGKADEDACGCECNSVLLLPFTVNTIKL